MFKMPHTRKHHRQVVGGGEQAIGEAGIAGSGFHACDRNQRKAFRMLYDFFRQINVQIRPIEMTGRELLNVENRFYRLITKPRKIGIRKEQLFSMSKKPDPVP